MIKIISKEKIMAEMNEQVEMIIMEVMEKTDKTLIYALKINASHKGFFILYFR